MIRSNPVAFTSLVKMQCKVLPAGVDSWVWFKVFFCWSFLPDVLLTDCDRPGCIQCRNGCLVPFVAPGNNNRAVVCHTHWCSFIYCYSHALHLGQSSSKWSNSKSFCILFVFVFVFVFCLWVWLRLWKTFWNWDWISRNMLMLECFHTCPVCCFCAFSIWNSIRI